MTRLILLIGCSGTGKSTWAKEYNEKYPFSVELNRDEVRANLFLDGDQKNMWNRYKFTKAREKQVSSVIQEKALIAAGNKREIIISDTNLNKTYRDNWKQFANKNNYEYIEKFCNPNLTIDDLLKIDRIRKDFKSVGKDVLLKQWDSYYNQFGRKYDYQKVSTRPKAIIVDIDGTIAEGKRHRSMYDFSKVLGDSPRYDIMELVKYYRDFKGYKVLFLSGRSNICKDDTVLWINKFFGLNWDRLFMRKDSDSRKDRLVKEEIFWEDIANEYCVEVAIDDRPTIVRLWKDVGIYTVLDVSQSYLEF